MKPGWQRFAAHISEKIDNAHVAGGNHARGAKQEE